jgi:hypothetical protein
VPSSSTVEAAMPAGIRRPEATVRVQICTRPPMHKRRRTFDEAVGSESQVMTHWGSGVDGRKAFRDTCVGRGLPPHSGISVASVEAGWSIRHGQTEVRG